MLLRTAVVILLLGIISFVTGLLEWPRLLCGGFVCYQSPSGITAYWYANKDVAKMHMSNLATGRGPYAPGEETRLPNLLCPVVVLKWRELGCWAFQLPLTLPLFIAAGALALTDWRRQRTRPKNVCGKCGYDLRGCVSGRCPECGTAYCPGVELTDSESPPMS